MKKGLLIFCIVIAQLSFSQTELIAYKSHSGNMTYYKLSGFDNLGEPPMYIDSIIKLNDSTIVEYLSWGLNDTIVNHPVCNMPQTFLDSLKGNYYNNSMRFINFEPIQLINTDTVQTDSIIESIEIFGEEAEKTEKGNDIIPVEEENVSPPLTPQTKLVLNSPSNKLHLLWYGLFGFVTMLVLMVWYNHKPKLQV